MSIIDGIIPGSDLPKATAGAFDSVVGVNEADGSLRRFPVPVAGSPKAYATRASLPATAPEGTPAYVNNDPTSANNGLWAFLSGVWVLSVDRVTALGLQVAQQVGGVIDSLSIASQVVGHPLGAIADGALAAGAGAYTVSNPLTFSGNRMRFAFFGRGTGTAYVQVVSRAGTTNTIVREAAISVTPGYHEVAINLDFAAGQYVGVRNPANLLAVTSAPPGYSYWSTSTQVAAPGSYDDATLSSSVTFHWRVSLVAQNVTGSDFKAVADEVAGFTDVIGDPAEPSLWIGGQEDATPATGSAIGLSTYCIAEPVPRPMRAARISAYVRVPGTIKLRRFNRVGSLMTAVGDDLELAFDATGVVVLDDLPDFVLEAGQRYAIADAGSILSVVAAAPPNTGYYVGTGNTTSYTAASAIATYTIQLSIEFEPYSLERRISQLEDSTGPVADPALPDSFILVWALGESHMAGRGERHSLINLPDGAAYKFVRASGALVHLEDPTGNDATATAGSGAGSTGPALADAVWRMTEGAVGVVMVNSALGGTRIGTHWGVAGSAWTQAVTDWGIAVAAIKAAGLPVAGFAVHLAIGSNDAAAAVDKATFKAAVLDFHARCRAVTGVGSDLPLVLAQTGNFTDGTSAAAVQNIRDAQNELVAENASIFMGWSGAKTFVARDLMLDNVHYRQAGNDIMGRSTAPVLLARAAGRYVPGLG